MATKQGSDAQKNHIAAVAVAAQVASATLTKAAGIQQIVALGYYVEEAQAYLKSVTTT